MAEEGSGSVPRQGDEEESTFKFPIHEPQEDEEIKMKNIPPFVLQMDAKMEYLPQYMSHK